jgi:hypothetical protein
MAELAADEAPHATPRPLAGAPAVCVPSSRFRSPQKRRWTRTALDLSTAAGYTSPRHERMSHSRWSRITMRLMRLFRAWACSGWRTGSSWRHRCWPLCWSGTALRTARAPKRFVVVVGGVLLAWPVAVTLYRLRHRFRTVPDLSEFPAIRHAVWNDETDMRTDQLSARKMISVAGALCLALFASSCSTDHPRKASVPVLGGNDSLSPGAVRTSTAGPTLHDSPQAAQLEHLLRQMFGAATDHGRWDRYRLTLSGNGRYLLVSTYKDIESPGRPMFSSARIIDTQTMQVGPQLPSSQSLAISDDGRYVAQAITGADVSVFDAQHPDRWLDAISIPSKSEPNPLDFVEQMIFSRDDSRLLVRRNGRVDVYRVSTQGVPVSHPFGNSPRERQDILTSVSLPNDSFPEETVGFGTDDESIIAAGFGTVHIWSPSATKPRVVDCRCATPGSTQPQITPDGRTIRFIQGNELAVWDTRQEHTTGFIHSQHAINDRALTSLPSGLIAAFDYSGDQTPGETTELEIFRPDGTVVSQQPIRNDLLSGRSDKPMTCKSAFSTSGGLAVLVVSKDTRAQSGPPAMFRVLALS